MDLPDKDEQIRWIYPSKEFLNLQCDIINAENGDVIDTGDYILDLKDGSTKARKLREITSGFIYYHIGEDRHTYFLKQNPKVEALLDLIEDSDGKIIVYHKYIAEAEMIEKAFKKNKINFKICS